MANITEIRGNIFESTCQTIVNTVNCVGVMGKGIAFEYRHRYPEMFLAYSKLCEQKQLRPGLLHLWTKSTPWILNFPTKNDWKFPSKHIYISDGLKKFSETYRIKRISSIAFPELGTSSGGLRWEDVKILMYQFLEPLPNLDVEIYHFDSNAQDSYFDKLYQKIHRFSLPDYKDYLGIAPKQAKLLKDAIHSKDTHSMIDIQNIDGLGEQTFKKIYAFVNSLDSDRLITHSERQPGLDF